MTDPGEVSAELERRVAQRRRDGTYPDGADEALERDVDHRLRAAARQTSELRAAVERLREAGPYHLRSRADDRGLKALYAATVERLVGHALRDIIRQLDEHEAALLRVLDVVTEQLERRDADAP